MKIKFKFPDKVKEFVDYILSQPSQTAQIPQRYERPIRSKAYREGCPFCGSAKFVQLTTRKLCMNCNETYNKMKSVKLDYITPVAPTQDVQDMIKMFKIKK